MTGGCAVIRLADFYAPAVRFDRPNNKPLPPREDPAVTSAVDQWAALAGEERQRYPTPYHLYVDTPAPGTFEGGHIVGLAFSGGGTRGTVFCAVCLKEIERLGPIVVDAPDGRKEINLLDEVDYVSGVSTGAIPAAAFALRQSPHCPRQLAYNGWPDCFNVGVTAYSLKRLFIRPDRFLRDMAFDMNTRPTAAGGVAGLFFEGNPYKTGGGLAFRDLPPAPVLLIGATLVDDPGAPFVQTRMPYRYALDKYPELPWGVGVQSFESFHSDPMVYALGEACYNSSAYPGFLRAGLMRMKDDPGWILENLEPQTRERMAKARFQSGFEHTYTIKDGGLVDNRGIDPIDRLFETLVEKGTAKSQPLLIALDAGYRELRKPEPGRRLIKKGWMTEAYDSSSAAWRTGQEAYERLHEEHVEAGLYALARFRYVAWLRYLRPEDVLKPSGSCQPGPDAAEPEQPCPATDYLTDLCRREPLVGNPARLLEITRAVGTTLGKLTPSEMAAIRITARFAVWHEKDALLDWASARHNGAPARFAYPQNSARFVSD